MWFWFVIEQRKYFRDKYESVVVAVVVVEVNHSFERKKGMKPDLYFLFSLSAFL